LQGHAANAFAAGADTRGGGGQAGGRVVRREAKTGVGHRRPSLSGVNETTDSPRFAFGLGLGWLAAAAFAVVYALSAELIGLTFGLPIVALLGGWIIGTVVAYAAWGEGEHPVNRGLRVGALALAVEGWALALILAYILSQAFIPQASTQLTDRLSVGGFLDYLLGLDIVRFIHLLSLAFVAVMAWRAAR
jgi:hypothetical protein